MRYGRLRRGSCHGAGLGGVVPRDADALCEQEEHAAPRETKEACAQAVEDRRHGLFELLYRHGDGYSDCALQPPDHAIPRLGRARDLRPHQQRQHIRPVLRVQRRTGIPAHHFDEFRRGERGSHPRDAAICAVDGRIFRRFLDGAERGVPESLHPHFYEPDGGNLGDGPGHHPRVCDLIPAAAVQHLLDVLFPGHLTAEGGVYRVGRARTRHQRCTDPDAAASRGRGFALVRHAHHGACHRRLRCGVHPQIHRAARRKSHLTKRGHRRIIMAEF